MENKPNGHQPSPEQVENSAINKVLKNKALTTPDVKAFMEEHLKAQKLVIDSLTSYQNKREKEYLYKNSKRNLDNWEINRTGVLQELLEKISISKDKVEGETDEETKTRTQKTKAYAACATVLLDEPLFTGVTKENLVKSLSILGFKPQHPVLYKDLNDTIIRTLSSAIVYNVRRFNKELYEEENYERELRMSKNIFTRWLYILQGKEPPLIIG